MNVLEMLTRVEEIVVELSKSLERYSVDPIANQQRTEALSLISQIRESIPNKVIDTVEAINRLDDLWESAHAGNINAQRDLEEIWDGEAWVSIEMKLDDKRAWPKWLERGIKAIQKNAEEGR